MHNNHHPPKIVSYVCMYTKGKSGYLDFPQIRKMLPEKMENWKSNVADAKRQMQLDDFESREISVIFCPFWVPSSTYAFGETFVKEREFQLGITTFIVLVQIGVPNGRKKCTDGASLEKFAVTKEPLSICADPQIDLMMLIVCGVIHVIGAK